MPIDVHNLLPVACALGLALVLTPVVRSVARRLGLIARPRADRWNRKPTAMVGGVAIFAATLVPCLALVPLQPRTALVLAGSALLFLVGLVDDLRRLKPYQKLIGQLVGASLLVSSGLRLPWTGWPLLNMGITLFWLIGITNAINLLDNMDGLAAGIALIASVFLMLNFLWNGQATEALLLAVFAATLLGFLVYNFNPASIFMGDCGSLFIGFFLAGAALLHTAGGRSRSFLPVLAVPVLILFIPIFDTTLVMVLRKLAGRAATQGGRDHTSHRLVKLGLSERRAVLLLYGLAALSGVIALLVRDLQLDVSLGIIAIFTLGLTLLGIHLAQIKVYEEQPPATRTGQVVAFLVDLSYKRRVFEVVLDVVLIILAYYLATLLRFGPLEPGASLDHFLRAVPVLVVVKLGAFLAVGVYRGIWRSVSVVDLVQYGKAVVLGSLGSVPALLLLFRFEGFSRGVIVADCVILGLLLCGSRLAFRLLRGVLPRRNPDDGRRALIYGAGDAGELLLREIRNNQKLSYIPVGFADDDPRKAGKLIHGLRVFGGNGSLLAICREQRVEVVFISSNRFPDERVREIVRDCEQAGIGVERLRLQIETLRAANLPRHGS